MWKLRPLFSLLAFCLLCLSPPLAAAQRSTSPWQTLAGDAPRVIARGGFSGIFPDSSYNAHVFALNSGLPDLVTWCDLQLSKDGIGVCIPDVKLDNFSDVVNVFKSRPSKKFLVNGVLVDGHFTVDFTAKELKLLTLSQNIQSRTERFDGLYQIQSVDDLLGLQPPAIWLNIQHDAYYSQQNQSMRSFVIAQSRKAVVNYISSPEVGFLRSIVSRFRPPTKLIFRFLAEDVIEPSTNQSYGSLLKNLTFIKMFASGILVPKSYIQPVDSDNYLLPPTSLVSDAHKAGLEIHASEFSSDVPLAYDYNYDPVSEYLSYVDNGNFSVDGVLSDFPITPSATIDCFSHMGRNETDKDKFLIISSEGASGQYPGCTDIAYSQAIADGVDVIDCPVQMSQDGIPFCLGSINLIDRTMVAQSAFVNVSMNLPNLGIQSGIFAFNLTWSQIQSLTPAISNPWAARYNLYRNPKGKNSGKIVQLSEFLEIAKNASSVSGVLIGIEHAAFLAQDAGLGVVDAVLDALNTSGYNNPPGKKVYIQSQDSSVLKKIGKTSNYELVYNVDESISDVTNATISDIKEFATSVVVYKYSIFPTSEAFLTGVTKVANTFDASGVPLYVQVFSNEFVSQAFDFLSDPYVEINTFISLSGVQGVATGFPFTSSRFRKNRCLAYKEPPPYMVAAQPGALLQAMSSMPPAEAPLPSLDESAVVEPPLPPVITRPPPSPSNETTSAPPTASPSGNGQGTIVANSGATCLALLLVSFAILMS